MAMTPSISIQDPTLANENWDRFLPEFKKKNVQRKKPKVVGTKKVYTPFPPAPTPSKVDLQLESGEYFLNEKQRQQKQRVDKRMKMAEVAQDRRNERMKDYVAPKETGVKVKKNKKKKGTADKSSSSFSSGSGSKKQQIESLKQSFLTKSVAKVVCSQHIHPKPNVLILICSFVFLRPKLQT